jgi:phosphoribosylformimino-5-aminoimidazole carboxamide ribotide isomerase
MIVFPAIDLLNGRAVRLLNGDYGNATDYGDPIERAVLWERQGAEFLHVVDWDGAKYGGEKNGSVLADIVRSVKIPVQSGGGVRTLKNIERMLDVIGVKRVILGTVCCSEPDLVETAVRNFGQDGIAAGIDVKNGRVAVKGWLESTDITPIELGARMYGLGVKYAVYTDISRDGALTGVNTEACADMQRKTKLRCIASGGVSSLEDIAALKDNGVYGAVLGKAIYESRFTVRSAVDLSKNKGK